MGAGKVIVTLGAQGSLFANGKDFEHFPAPKVKAVDTTAAGDTLSVVLPQRLPVANPRLRRSVSGKSLQRCR
jgi:bifunctional ADP-heptose synthase (sugar kinase/adenylyltransferase)